MNPADRPSVPQGVSTTNPLRSREAERVCSRALPAFVGESLRAQLENMHVALMEPWARPADERLQIAVRHALDFRTWMSLASNGLTPGRASALMTAMVAGLAD